MDPFCLLESWLIREAGFWILTRRKQRVFGVWLDSRLSYKFLKWLTGNAGLNTEVGEVQKMAAGTIRKEIRN